MPALPSTAVLGTLSGRNATGTSNTTTAATIPPSLQVICEFPLSGQYGLGSRLLYYTLIVACVLWKKSELLKKACLAAALIFPAVAAIHGIVLAALHRDGVVDMDLFGVFQLCAIGILAAPVTVKLSTTYFFDPGRNLIFMWTILILTGLLSLTVEFFRSNPVPCRYNYDGQPLSSNPRLFNYNDPPTCNLTCNITAGPFSPIRRGSANNIYIVPAPDRISFGMAALLAAACCIPAVLHLMSMWNKILQINWKSRFGNQDVDRQAPIEGTNGATLETMKKVNADIRKFLIFPEIVVFGGAVLFILVVGEMNFFSPQVSWQSEPMSAIGQWAPIVGTILAVLGSLYHIRHRGEEKDQTTCDHVMCGGQRDKSPDSSHYIATPGTTDGRHSLSNGGGRTSAEAAVIINPLPRAVTATDGKPSQGSMSTTNPLQRAKTWRDGGRRRVARTLTSLSDRLVTPTQNQFDDSTFRRGPAIQYPRVPAEELRNKNLNDTETRYDVTTRLRKQHSRAGSFTGSTNSGVGIISVRDAPTTTPSRAPSRAPSPRRSLQGGEAATSSASGEVLQKVASPTTTPGSNDDMLQRRSTLEVPSVDHQGRTRTFPTTTAPLTISDDNTTNQAGPSSPVIVVSPDFQSPDP